MPIDIATKIIIELKGFRFLIPSYQRGYRWTKQEVTAFLEDLKEFSDDNGKRKYCFQPLVVKQRDDGMYEVVDGQQRLTTIYIFIKLAADEIRSAVPPFNLEYETRKDSGGFLKELSSNSPFITHNIDYFHILTARDEMLLWLEKQPDKSAAIIKLYEKILSHTFFIWYELPSGSDPIAMFTKINLGKIPLTNAELIKALLLKKENFKSNSNKRQIEISTAWDRIEQGLRDDSLWFFLNQEEKSGTRIDLLFELISNDYNKKLSNPIQETVKDYFPFLVFAEIQKNIDDKKMEEQFVESIWNEIESLYSEFCSWYADLDKYHIIGFLIACGSTIQSIQRETRSLRKSEVRTTLIKLIKDDNDISKIDWDNLAYNERSNSGATLKKILLLFNIATLVCKSEKQYRFPFDIYKMGKWDLEHIHAVKDELPQTVIDTVSYLEALSKEFVDSERNEYADKITNFLAQNDKTKRNFRQLCVDFYEQLKVIFSEELSEDNNIRNLTLLNAEINRSYGNVTFMQKRMTIIERDSKGLFIPLCTKNVFAKYYYNSEPSVHTNWLRWNEYDRQDYAQSMRNIIETFLSGGVAQCKK